MRWVELSNTEILKYPFRYIAFFTFDYQSSRPDLYFPLPLTSRLPMSSKPKLRLLAYLVILLGILCPVLPILWAVFTGDVNFWGGFFVGIV